MNTWLILTDSQKDAAISLGASPRQITSGGNFGLWACPYSLLDDPKYAEWAQGLSFLPLYTMSPTALFS
jgi:hypothetical protein